LRGDWISEASVGRIPKKGMIRRKTVCYWYNYAQILYK
jgi:hypothetical protein